MEISNKTLEILARKIKEYYENEGYNGEFGDSVRFIERNGNIELVGEEYGKFMLFGRSSGKMPPIKPIMSWCDRYGITVSPWAVAVGIAKSGTKGTNFVEKNIEDFTFTIENCLAEDIETSL